METAEDLLDKLDARIVGLLGNEKFDQEQGGAVVPPVYHWQLPPKRDQLSDNYVGDFPHILIRPVNAVTAGVIGSIDINGRAAVWTNGTYADGARSLDRLFRLLFPLQQSYDFQPWGQDTEFGMQWQFGDEDGDNPHPYHYLYFRMRFQFDAGFNNYY